MESLAQHPGFQWLKRQALLASGPRTDGLHGVDLQTEYMVRGAQLEALVLWFDFPVNYVNDYVQRAKEIFEASNSGQED